MWAVLTTVIAGLPATVSLVGHLLTGGDGANPLWFLLGPILLTTLFALPLAVITAIIGLVLAIRMQTRHHPNRERAWAIWTGCLVAALILGAIGIRPSF